MTRTGIDTVASTAAEWLTLAAASGVEPQVIGSYGNGRYANSATALAALPGRVHVQYDVSGALPECDLLDIEPQDAVPADAPGWSRRWKTVPARRVLRGPGLYCSASTVSEVITDMLDSGWRRREFVVQSAHYGPDAHICGPDTCGYPQADSTQHANHGPHGENVDLSLWSEACFAVPRRDPDARYELFDHARRALIGGATERDTVQEYDRWRATQTRTRHPHRLRLGVLRWRCRRLAGRLERIMHQKPIPTGQDPNHRFWRWRELRDRGAGMRLV